MKRLLPGKPFLPVNNLILLVAADKEGKPYMMTIGSIGFNCTNPPRISIALRSTARCYSLLESNKDFTINFPSVQEMWAIDKAGKSQLSRDKMIEATNLTPLQSRYVKPPIIKECPVNFECRVHSKVKMGVTPRDHDLFISDVLATHINEDCLVEGDRFSLEKARLLVSNGISHEYWSLGSKLGEDGLHEKVPNPHRKG